ncbi:hypothetical protein [Streptomyces lancefieldiae]|uniref:Secreted protein n=1 Tax=Streptomyces lancefieldiae TaxID=3075520 RepID=A0ABU3AXL9_9ACTN|nr:hypothetical protein [Streptomyces sp. DSM 40712]MDT0614937.1 hypothetical protein [Streptomyces sp. DSM 40712]
MRQSSWAVIAALAVSVLCAAEAKAVVPRAAHLPGDVAATERVRGGGVVISADGEGTGSSTARGQGGTHDGETIT